MARSVLLLVLLIPLIAIPPQFLAEDSPIARRDMQEESLLDGVFDAFEELAFEADLVDLAHTPQIAGRFYSFTELETTPDALFPPVDRDSHSCRPPPARRDTSDGRFRFA